jgi:hypothetical protein
MLQVLNRSQKLLKSIINYMKVKFLLALLITALHVLDGTGQEKHTISGIITDAKSNETLIGASIFIPALKTGVITNEYGFYSLTLPANDYNLRVSNVGYESIISPVNLRQDIKQNFHLIASEQELEEVIILTDKSATNIRKAEMSVNKLNIAAIKKMPVVLGETDVLKSILMLPGVTNAGEGSSGFNVRGGGADQNLILLDEATIFNSSHVFGFFSVFNPDAIKDMKLYKGGISARYGGRVSSVLDIYQKDGSSSGFHVNGGIGIVSSRLLAEGPIVKDKGSFLIGGRASYGHLLLKLSDNKNAAYFYDLNTKLSYKLNDANSVYLSGYFGRDLLDIDSQFENIYGNSTVNFRWNHVFADKLFSNLSLIYSDYYYGLNLDLVGFHWDSGIRNYNIKYDFKNYISSNLKLNYGVNGIYYEFNPGTLKAIGNSGINPRQLDYKYALEPAVYIDAEQNISKKWSLSYGLRYSLFYRLGASTINIYQNNLPVLFNQELQIYEKAKPVGSKYYGSDKVIADYHNVEPRAAIAYQLSENQSIKASYHRMVQYLQLISNTASPTPLDVWTPSDEYLKPQIADQAAIGYFRNFKDNMYSLEAEAYYKKVQNRLDYIDGADLVANEALEQIVLSGRMRSYGLEILFRKNEGKLTGWFSYTLSKSEQQTPGRSSFEPGINGGEWYHSIYDKLHNVAVTSSYAYSKKWSFGANFTLQSGQPATFPNGQYQYRGVTVASYGLRNDDKLPAYHHLDISATLTPRKKMGRKWQSEWVFSIYNIYGRSNTASLSFSQNAQNGMNEAQRLSIFGIVPGVSYNFKF